MSLPLPSVPVPVADDDPVRVLGLVLAATLEGMVQHDLVSGVSTYSERWHRLLGFDAETQLPDSPTLWLELTHPDDVEAVREEWDNHVLHAWPFQRVWRMRHKHGGYRWVECRSVVRLGADGDPLMALSLFSDVSDRVEAGQRHQALIEALPDALLRVTGDGLVVDFRPGLGDMGDVLFADQESTGRPLAELTRPEGLAEELLSAVRSAIADQKVVQIEPSFEGVRARRWMEVRVSPSGSSEAVLLLRDTTTQKHMASQLLLSQKLNAIGQLAAGIAHEINTPLQYIGDNAHFVNTALTSMREVIEGMRGIIAQSEVGPTVEAQLVELEEDSRLDFILRKGPKAIASCMDGVERVAEIVAAMREFSHPGGAEAIASDLNHAIQNTLTVCKNEWKHIAQVETDFEDDLPLVVCFPGELNQCLLNIIVNAAHAMQDRYGSSCEGRLHISTTHDDEFATIRIEDNGPGIPEDIRERVFDPFFTTKEVGKGTGQGLSIARKTIVERHHGEILCESAVDQGTTFVIRLPVNGAPQKTSS